MCGIAGIFDTRYAVCLRDLAAALAVMRHRGPDDTGVYISPNKLVGLASCRLAILDPTPAGHMPMTTPDEQVIIVHNGEVYNFAELRDQLQRLGYRFCSGTDTEVILYSYIEWGERCVERFRGMFSFAIWDQRPHAGAKGRLFIARDHLGIKPLYYSYTNGLFIFASELKALRIIHPQASLKIDPVSVIAYLMRGSVPNPRTIYENVFSLEPGHTLVLQDDRLEITRYWEPPTVVDKKLKRSEAIEQVRSLLEESVRLQLISDVPLGAFLSGGLDSTVLVALMCRLAETTVRTCSMVFEEYEYSEASYARSVAEQYDTEHYERVITAREVEQQLEHIIWAMDQPTVDGVNTYFVSKTAREAGLTVALSGLGGDELFGGYVTSFQGVPQVLRALRVLYALPRATRLGMVLVNAWLQQGRWSRLSDALGRIPTLAGAYVICRGLFSQAQVNDLLAPGVQDTCKACFDAIDYVEHVINNIGAPNDKVDVFNWVSRAELRAYTHNQLLRDTDVMSMAHSLEVRVPLLDHQLVETVLQIPASIKQQGVGVKPLLLTAVEDLLPESVRERQIKRTKQGFTFPFDIWLRGILRKWFENEMGYLAARNGLLRYDAVQQLWNGFLNRKVHWSRIWAIGVLLAWQRQVTNGSYP